MPSKALPKFRAVPELQVPDQSYGFLSDRFLWDPDLPSDADALADLLSDQQIAYSARRRPACAMGIPVVRYLPDLLGCRWHPAFSNWHHSGWQAVSRKTGSMKPTLWRMKNRGKLNFRTYEQKALY